MFELDWKKQLAEKWKTKLETSLDLDRAQKVHLVAAQKGAGEIHRFVWIGGDRPDAKSVVKRIINDLAGCKLVDCDPEYTTVLTVEWDIAGVSGVNCGS